jgi:hypothetical protein
MEHYFGRTRALFGSALIILSGPLNAVSRVIWTESLFATISFLFLIVMDQYLKHRGKGTLVIAVCLAALSSMIRIIGVVNIALLGVAIIYWGRHRLSKSVAVATWSCAVAATPLLMWMMRNYGVDGTLLGPRYPAVDTLATSLERVMIEIGSWFLPAAAAKNHVVMIAIPIVLLGGVSVAVYVSTKKRAGTDYHYGFPALLYGLFILLYGGFLVASLITNAYDPINSRLLAPVYVPFILLLMYFVQTVTKTLEASRRVSRGITYLGYFTLVLFTAFLGVRVTIEISGVSSDTYGGYNSPSWRDSETIDAIINQLDNPGTISSDVPIVVYSNNPQGLAFVLLDRLLAGEIAVKESPQESPYRSTLIGPAITDFAGKWPAESPAMLAWFDNPLPYQFFSLQDLDEIARLELLGNYSDGHLYLISRGAE